MGGFWVNYRKILGKGLPFLFLNQPASLVTEPSFYSRSFLDATRTKNIEICISNVFLCVALPLSFHLRVLCPVSGEKGL
jgi:hypothetical protein